MSLPKVYETVRPGIVAFAPFAPDAIRKGSRHFDLVFGTGFIVDDSLIATNAHVAQEFDNIPSLAGQPRVVAMFFSRVPGGLGTVLLNVTKSVVIKSIGNTDMYFGPEDPDVALVAVNCRGLAKYALKLTAEPILEGTAIATAGFPMGNVLMHLEGQLDHPAPTLQAGIVSATLPYPGASFSHGYLINVMVQGGASGSPVFLADSGEVIGAVYASRLEVDAQGRALPTNFSHVVPSFFLAETLKQAREELAKYVAPDANHIDDVLASMPAQPAQKITQGLFGGQPPLSHS